MELQTFLDEITAELGKAHNSIAQATTPEAYAQAAYDHLQNLRDFCNQMNEGGTQIDEFPSVPQ